MSDNSVDPSGNTEAFRAFTQAPEPESGSKTPLIIGVVAGVVVLAVVVGLVVMLAG